MSIAVLIHGCHLQADGWEEIVWGDPPRDVLGRVPKGILEALRRDARTIVFSTGASEKNGVLEGEYIYRYALDHLNGLRECTGLSKEQLRTWLADRAVLELTSQNTRSEVLASAKLAHDRGAKELVLVSSPSHIMRCHRDAIAALGGDATLRHFLRDLSAVASDTCFKGTTVDDVVIIEPPHRGDQPKWQTYRYARAMFQVLRQGEGRFESFLKSLGHHLETYGVPVDWNPKV